MKQIIIHFFDKAYWVAFTQYPITRVLLPFCLPQALLVLAIIVYCMSESSTDALDVITVEFVSSLSSKPSKAEAKLCFAACAMQVETTSYLLIRDEWFLLDEQRNCFMNYRPTPSR